MTGEHITARLAVVSALRALCLSLPHIPTPTELKQLKRFETLVDRPETATERDVDALAAGWACWWRDGRTAELSAMAAQLGPALIDSDRRLASFVVACAISASPNPRT
jgi:hypothetical protein